MDTTTIASWNVNSLNVRLPHLEEWLKLRAPDIVALQETKLEDARFPDDALAALGYRSVFAGQKTYNGVAILSRTPLRDVVYGIPGFDDEQARVIAGSVVAMGRMDDVHTGHTLTQAGLSSAMDWPEPPRVY